MNPNNLMPEFTVGPPFRESSHFDAIPEIWMIGSGPRLLDWVMHGSGHALLAEGPNPVLDPLIRVV
jgi:hypothetical protein